MAKNINTIVKCWHYYQSHVVHNSNDKKYLPSQCKQKILKRSMEGTLFTVADANVEINIIFYRKLCF